MTEERTFHENQGEIGKLHSEVNNLRKLSSRTGSQVNNILAQIQRIEERCSKFNSDMIYTQQQLESVIASLEKEHDIIADHGERLRLVTDKNNKNRGSTSRNKSAPVVLVLTRWLYAPLTNLIKGTYSIFSPVVYTFHSLSLFNSNISKTNSPDSGDDERFSQNAGDMNDIFSMLQTGKLDPKLVNPSKR